MKKSDLFIKKIDSLDRYCSMKCDSGNCLGCRIHTAKDLIFKMEKCDCEDCNFAKCQYVNDFRKISSYISSKISKVR